MDVRLEEESMATTRFNRPLQIVSEVVSKVIKNDLIVEII